MKRPDSVCKRVALMALTCVLLTTPVSYAAAFQMYPGAKPVTAKAASVDSKAEAAKAKPGAADKAFATSDDFARVAYFYRAIGKEQKMPDGVGDGSARATFTFDSGESVLISHARPSGDPSADQTFIEVHGGDFAKAASEQGEELSAKKGNKTADAKRH